MVFLNNPKESAFLQFCCDSTIFVKELGSAARLQRVFAHAVSLKIVLWLTSYARRCFAVGAACSRVCSSTQAATCSGCTRDVGIAAPSQKVRNGPHVSLPRVRITDVGCENSMKQVSARLPATVTSLGSVWIATWSSWFVIQILAASSDKVTNDTPKVDASHARFTASNVKGPPPPLPWSWVQKKSLP